MEPPTRHIKQKNKMGQCVVHYYLSHKRGDNICVCYLYLYPCLLYTPAHAYTAHTVYTILYYFWKDTLTLPLATSEEGTWVAEGQGWEADFSLHNTLCFLALNFVQLSIGKEILKQAAIRHASSSSPSH